MDNISEGGGGGGICRSSPQPIVHIYNQTTYKFIHQMKRLEFSCIVYIDYEYIFFMKKNLPMNILVYTTFTLLAEHKSHRDTSPYHPFSSYSSPITKSKMITATEEIIFPSIFFCAGLPHLPFRRF